MNFKLLLILIVAAGGLSYGFLGNDIALDIQKFDVIIMPPGDGSMAGATQFNTVTCACGTDPTHYETYGVCDQSESSPGVPTSTSLGLSGNMLCPGP